MSKEKLKEIITFIIFIGVLLLMVAIPYRVGYSVNANKVIYLDEQLAEQQEYYENQLEDYQQELLNAQDEIDWFENKYKEADQYGELLEWLLYTNQELLSIGVYIDIDGDIHYENDVIDGYVSEDLLEQIMNDFEQTIEVIQEYYEETEQSQNLGYWVQQNYPELYARITAYEELY